MLRNDNFYHSIIRLPENKKKIYEFLTTWSNINHLAVKAKISLVLDTFL